MFAMILGLPTWLKAALVGAALLGAVQVQHWWEVRGLNNQIKNLTMELGQEKVANAELRIAVSDVSANRDKLVSTIKEQNGAIELLRADGQRLSAEASLRVTRAFERGRAVSEGLRSPTSTVPPGHAGMNEWLANAFKEAQ